MLSLFSFCLLQSKICELIIVCIQFLVKLALQDEADQISIQIETDESVTEDISDQNCMESYRESERYKYKSENSNYYEIKFW